MGQCCCTIRSTDAFCWVSVEVLFIESSVDSAVLRSIPRVLQQPGSGSCMTSLADVFGALKCLYVSAWTPCSL